MTEKEIKTRKLLRTDEALLLLKNKFGMEITKPTLIKQAKIGGFLLQPGGKFNHYFFDPKALEKFYDPTKNKTI